MPRRGARMGGDGRSEVPGLALLPPPGQIQDWWWGLGCLEGCRLLERARIFPRSDSGSQCGSSSGGRTGGVAEGHRLQDQHRPSAGSSPFPLPAPNPRGVSPHMGWGQREPRKSQRRQLQNHRSPFIAQPSRARPPPQSKEQGGNPRAQPNPASRTTGQGGMGAWGQEGAP